MIVIEFINKEIVNLSRIDAKVEVTTNIVTSNILFISTKYRTESGEITTIGRVTDKRDPVTDECRNRLYNIFIKTIGDIKSIDGVDYSQGISFGYTLDFKSEDKYYADLIGFMHSKVGVNDIIETKTPISTPL